MKENRIKILILTLLIIIALNSIGIILIEIIPNSNHVKKSNALYCFNESRQKDEKYFNDCIDDLGVK